VGPIQKRLEYCRIVANCQLISNHHDTLTLDSDDDDDDDDMMMMMMMIAVVAFVQLSEKCLDAFDEGAPIVVDMPSGL